MVVLPFAGTTPVNKLFSGCELRPEVSFTCKFKLKQNFKQTFTCKCLPCITEKFKYSLLSIRNDTGL